MKISDMYSKKEIRKASQSTQIEYAIETGEVLDCLMGNGCYSRKGTDVALSICCIDTAGLIFGLNNMYEKGIITPEDADDMLISLMEKDGIGLLVAIMYISEYLAIKKDYLDYISLELNVERLQGQASIQYLKFEDELNKISRFDQIGLRENAKYKLLNINNNNRKQYGFDIIG